MKLRYCRGWCCSHCSFMTWHREDFAGCSIRQFPHTLAVWSRTVQMVKTSAAQQKLNSHHATQEVKWNARSDTLHISALLRLHTVISVVPIPLHKVWERLMSLGAHLCIRGQSTNLFGFSGVWPYDPHPNPAAISLETFLGHCALTRSGPNLSTHTHTHTQRGCCIQLQ